MNNAILSSWITMDSVFSEVFYGALRRVLERDGVSDDIRGFVEVVAVPSWILESIVNTAIVRWFHLLGTPTDREVASVLARSYLENADFFGDDVAESIRAEFSNTIVEVATLVFKQPHPAGTPWN